MEIAKLSETEKACLNCGTQSVGRYCPECGQEKSDKTVCIQSLGKEFITDQFGYEARLWRTLKYLLIRPGYLTNEYIAGKRIRYLSPFRTYLFLSVAFFLVFAWLENPNQTLRELIKAEDTAPKTQRSDSVSVSSSSAPDKKLEKRGEKAAEKSEAKTGQKHPKLSFSFGDLPPTIAEYEAWQRDPKNRDKHSPFQQYMAKKSIAASQLGPADFLIRALDNLPKILFALVPVFALLLKLLYLRSKRLYIEHLIFALHSHAFVFVALILMELIQNEWFILSLFLLVLPFYFFRAMRAVYRQSFWKTLVKFWLLGSVYFFVLLFGIVLVFFVTLLTV
jgi:hypothetical protein